MVHFFSLQEEEAKLSKSKTKEEVKTALFTDPKPEPIKTQETVTCDQSSQESQPRASKQTDQLEKTLQLEGSSRRSLRPRKSMDVKEGNTENGASLDKTELKDGEETNMTDPSVSNTGNSASNNGQSETVTETGEDQSKSKTDEPMEVDVTSVAGAEGSELQQKVSPPDSDMSGGISTVSTSATETASEVGTDPTGSGESSAMVSD